MTATSPPPLVLDDEQWERVTTLTGGATLACFQCGVCTASCPWTLVQGQPLRIRELVRRVQLGADGADEGLWRCTFCRQCVALCPRGVDVPEVVRGLRREAWRGAEEPEQLDAVLWSLHQDGNPLGQPPSQRAAWAEGLDLPRFDPAAHEVLLYIGCSCSYDPRLQRVARSLVAVLCAAGVGFGVLGEDEPCCGEAALALGSLDYLDELAARGSRVLAEAGVGTLVALSPHCVDAFVRHHDAGESFRPLHHVEYLAELLAQDRLPSLSLEAPAVVAYHDPCELGRARGIYDEPRALIAAIDGVELVEMEDNREQALCCGGGGGRLWLDTPLEERFAPRRVAQALDVGAKTIATACPACLSCLEDGMRAAPARLPVADVVELMAQALAGSREDSEGAGGR